MRSRNAVPGWPGCGDDVSQSVVQGGNTGSGSVAKCAAGVAVLMLAVTLPIEAQQVVVIKVRSDHIAAGQGKSGEASCTWSHHLFAETRADPKDAAKMLRESDTVRTHVVDAAGADVATPAPLRVDLTNGQSQTINAGDKSAALAVGVRELPDRLVRVSRTEPGAAPLCNVGPAMGVYVARDLGVTHHNMFAGGEVSNALRTGASSGAATGNLGVHSYLYRTPANPYQFPFGFLPRWRWLRPLHKLSYGVDVEELVAMISVASSDDSLYSPGRRQEFAQAVLAPLTASRGTLGSVSLLYSPQQQYGIGSAIRGMRLAATASRSRWSGDVALTNAPGAALAVATRDVTLFSADARWRWVFINHLRDPQGNTFSFAGDLGVTYRGVAGDIAGSDTLSPKLLDATLGTRQRKFWGPAGGVYLTFRQVTGFAELFNLRVSRDGNEVASLVGWQPLIGFRFEAPIFTITPQ